jgi:hypothetical protein
VCGVHLPVPFAGIELREERNIPPCSVSERNDIVSRIP